MPWDANDDEDVKKYKKVLDTRDKMQYLEGVLDGINQLMDNSDEPDYAYYLWHEVRGKLDSAYDEAKELGIKVIEGQDND